MTERDWRKCVGTLSEEEATALKERIEERRKQRTEGHEERMAELCDRFRQ